MDILAKIPGSKDEALEALDFIVNVLKEHERDLDKLISELATVTEKLGDTGELSGKVDKLEEKIGNLQTQVSSLIGNLSSRSREALSAVGKEQVDQTAALPTVSGTPVTLRCKQWEDFQVLADKAQTLSFIYKEDEKVFEATALKGNQIIAYNGALPTFSAILKTWLSRQLDIPERSVLEGGLAIS